MDEVNDENLENSGQILQDCTDSNSKEDVPVCLRCLRPCNPITYYCPYCDSNDTVNPLTAYLPLVQIRYNYGFFGKIWRKIWYDETTDDIHKILYLIFLAIFVPFIFLIGVPVLLLSKKERAKLSKGKYFSLLLAILLMVLYILFFGASLGLLMHGY